MSTDEVDRDATSTAVNALLTLLKVEESFPSIQSAQLQLITNALIAVIEASKEFNRIKLTLIIAMERLLHCMSVTPTDRTSLVNKISTVVSQLMNKQQSAVVESWTKIRHLLATESDCLFWSSIPSELIVFDRLKLLSSNMYLIRAKCSGEKQRQQYILDQLLPNSQVELKEILDKLAKDAAIMVDEDEEENDAPAAAAAATSLVASASSPSSPSVDTNQKATATAAAAEAAEATSQQPPSAAVISENLYLSSSVNEQVAVAMEIDGEIPQGRSKKKAASKARNEEMEEEQKEEEPAQDPAEEEEDDALPDRAEEDSQQQAAVVLTDHEELEEGEEVRARSNHRIRSESSNNRSRIVARPTNNITPSRREIVSRKRRRSAISQDVLREVSRSSRHALESDSDSDSDSETEPTEAAQRYKDFQIAHNREVTPSTSSTATAAAAASSISPSSTSSLSSAWPLRIQFGKPLNCLLPLHPFVREVLKHESIVIVLPDFTDRVSFQVDAETRSTNKYALENPVEMTLGCINTNGETGIILPKPVRPAAVVTPSVGSAAASAASAASSYVTSSSLHPTVIDFDQIQTFLDLDWRALQNQDKDAQRPETPADLSHRLYSRDVSEQGKSKGGGFFPSLRAKYEEIMKIANKIAEDQDYLNGRRLILVASEVRSHLHKDTPDNTKYKFFTHALYMDELSLHPESLSQLSAVRLDGAEGYYLYLKLGFQFFNLHIEQMLFTFIHHQLEGESLWFIIPFNQLSKLYELAAKMYCVLYGAKKNISQDHCRIMGRALLYSKQLFPPLSLLKEYGIEYREVRLKSGEVLIAHGGYAHFGYSTHPGSTLSVSTNVVTDEWLKDGLPFLIDYFKWLPQLSKELQRMKKKKVGQAYALHLAYISINLCPVEFLCSFLHGLLNEAKLMINCGTVAAAVRGTICKYSFRTTEEWNRLADQCRRIIQLMHGVRVNINQINDAYWQGESAQLKKTNKPIMVCACNIAEDDSIENDSNSSEEY